MVTFKGETSEEKRSRLKSKIAQLIVAGRKKMLDLEDINNDLKYCEKELGEMGDFP
jgi:hypothetical protein